jgi:hypothetical protein
MARGIIFGGKTDEGSSCQKGSERERKCHCSNIARYNLVQGDFLGESRPSVFMREQ